MISGNVLDSEIRLKPNENELGADGYVKDEFVKQPCNMEHMCSCGFGTPAGSCAPISCEFAQAHKDRSGRKRRVTSCLDKECVYPFIVNAKPTKTKVQEVHQTKRRSGKLLTVEIFQPVVNCMACGSRMELEGNVSLDITAKVICTHCGEIHYLDLEFSVKTKDFLISNRNALLDLIDEENALRESNQEDLFSPTAADNTL